MPTEENGLKFTPWLTLCDAGVANDDSTADLHLPRKECPMHREIAYFPRDFIYLFHTSLTFSCICSAYNDCGQRVKINLCLKVSFCNNYNKTVCTLNIFKGNMKFYFHTL